ncbi:MAG: MSCRAMM family protein [Candidatus Asgardarchaeia archaeon]
MKNRSLFKILTIMFLIILLAISIYSPVGSTTSHIRSGEAPNISVRMPETVRAHQTTSAWWNTSYYYRVPVTITGSNGIPRKNEPVTVHVSFTANHAHVNSIRVINPDLEQVPYQITAQVLDNTGTYYQDVTLVFPVNITSDSTTYYIYYTSQEVEPPSFSSQLQTTYTGSVLTVDNGLYSASLNVGTGFDSLTINGHDFADYGFFAPTTPAAYSTIVQYVYVADGDDIRLISWHDNTWYKISKTDGSIVAEGVLDEGEQYVYSSYPTTELLKIESNNTLTFQIYDGTDDTWSYTGAMLYAWVSYHLHIATFDKGAKVEIWDLSDDNDNFNGPRAIYLGPGETWDYTRFDSDVVRILSNTTIYILGGSVEAPNAGSSWSGPETLSVAYGKNQTYYTVFAAPTDGSDAYIGIMALQDTTSVDVIDKATQTSVWSGTLNYLDVKVVDTDGGWFDIISDKPIVVYTAMHQDDEDSAVTSYEIGGIEILSNNKKYFVLNPTDPTQVDNINDAHEIVTVHYTTLYPNTIVYIQTKNGVTQRIYSDAYTDDSYQLAAGEGAVVYSNKPLAVRLYVWGLETTQEEAMIVMKREPELTQIQEVTSGPVFAQYKLYWNVTDNGLNAVDTVTFYYKYPLIEFKRELWWDNGFSRYSFEPVILHVDTAKSSTAYYTNKMVADGTELLVTDFTRVSEYVVGWSSSDYTGIGLLVKSLTVQGDEVFTPSYAYYEVAGGFSISSGRLDISTSVYEYSTLAGQTYKMTLSGYLVAGSDFPTASDISNLCTSTKYSLSTTVGDEEVSLRMLVNVKDLDSNPVYQANVTLYDPDGIKLFSKLSNSSGQVFFDKLGKLGDYTLITIYSTQYSVDVKTTQVVSLTDSDVGTIKNVDVTLSLANLTITVYDLLDRPVANDAVVTLKNSSDTSQVIAQSSTDANGKVVFEYLPGISYAIESEYTPGSPDESYNFTHYSSFTLSSSQSITVTENINDLYVQVLDYDGNPVSNVQVLRFNLNYSDSYQTLAITNSTGWAIFSRVLIGNMTIEARYSNAYGQLITDSATINLYDNASAQYTLNLPMATLTVRVYDPNHGSYLEGALVYVNKTDGTLIASTSTDSSGYATFENIQCNIDYNVSATKNGQWDYIVLSLTQSKTVQLNVSLTWLGPDTVLILHNNTLISSVWDDNVTLLVGFVNRTDGHDDVPLLQSEVNSVTYTIKLGSTIITQGTLTYLSNGNWTTTLDIGALNLNAGNIYTIVIQGDASTNATTGDTFADPTPITLTLVVDYADTNVIHSYSAPYEVEWGFNATLKFTFVDQHGIYLSNAITNAEIYLGSTKIHIYGSLIDLGNGTYVFQGNTSDINSLNLPVGNYSLILFFGKHNYLNKTITIQFNVLPRQTNLVSSVTSISVNWSNSFTFYVNFTSYGIPIEDANVWGQWDSGYSVNYISYQNGRYIFSINTTVVSAGTHTFTIYAEHYNYSSKMYTITIDVLELETNALPISDIQFTGNWSTHFTVVVEFVDLNHSSAIPDATISVMNWNSSGYTYTYSSGRYYITLLSEYMAPGNYSVTLRFSKPNYKAASLVIRVNVLIPLKIQLLTDQVEFLYWLESYNITVQIINQYNGSVVSNVTLLYTQSDLGITNLPVSYNSTIGAFVLVGNSTDFGSDGTYLFTLSIHKSGAVAVPKDVFIVIQKRPTKVYYTTPVVQTVYYGDILNINVTIEDINNGFRVTSPDTITASLIFGEVLLYSNITSIREETPGTYIFTIDTAYLNLSAGDTYTLRIYFEKTGFKIDTVVTYTILIQQTPTTLDITVADSVYWAENITFVIEFVDAVHNSTILDANVTLTISNITYYLNRSGNVYLLELNTSQFDVGVYLIRISGFAENYGPAAYSFQLSILNRTTTLNVQHEPEEETIIQGTADKLKITVTYVDSLRNAPIRGATVFLNVAGKRYVFTEYPNGSYILMLNMSVFNTTGSYTFIISAKKQNFEFQSYTFQITIEEPYISVGGVKVPIRSVVNVGGGASVAIAVMGLALYGYRIYKIPWIIRATDKAIKALIKGKPVDFSKFPDLNDLLEEEIAPMFSTVKKKIPPKTTEE